MQTTLDPAFARTAKGTQAEAILRKCVHCGFCNATCPTYQLLGDELDGPRGRIYLIKQLLEGEQNTHQIARHLDRCLTCRSCETTCPSGVEYGRLLEIGRDNLRTRHPRGTIGRVGREVFTAIVRSHRVFGLLLGIGHTLRPLLPASLKSGIPRIVPTAQTSSLIWPKAVHQRTMVVLAGCVQRSIAPASNLAAAVVLDKLGISLVEADGAGCCGSVDLHTTGESRAKTVARALIDRWWPYLDQGVEGFITSASGCGVTISEYPQLFHDDPEYLHKARAISAISSDLSEVIDREIDSHYQVANPSRKVAFHSPCTLQHGHKLAGTVEKILERVGYQLCEVKDSHICCGSAGTYSLFHPKISAKLKQNKLEAIYRDKPDVVCTANIGCQAHLSEEGRPSVRHWIELLL